LIKIIVWQLTDNKFCSRLNLNLSNRFNFGNLAIVWGDLGC